MAIGLVRALNAGKLQLTATKPRAITKTSIWPDRQAGRFRLHQAALNNILEKFSLGPWDITQLQAWLSSNPRFFGDERSGPLGNLAIFDRRTLRKHVLILKNLGSEEPKKHKAYPGATASPSDMQPEQSSKLSDHLDNVHAVLNWHRELDSRVPWRK